MLRWLTCFLISALHHWVLGLEAVKLLSQEMLGSNLGADSNLNSCRFSSTVQCYSFSFSETDSVWFLLNKTTYLWPISLSVKSTRKVSCFWYFPVTLPLLTCCLQWDCATLRLQLLCHEWLQCLAAESRPCVQPASPCVRSQLETESLSGWYPAESQSCHFVRMGQAERRVIWALSLSAQGLIDRLSTFCVYLSSF